MADNAELIRGVYDALARADVDAALAALDENVEWNLPEHHPYWPGGPLVGRQTVLEGLFARFAEDYDDFTIDVQRVVGCGDTVLVEVRYRATIKQTGKSLDAQGAHVFDLRDAKVVRCKQYGDTWQFAEVFEFTPALAHPSA